MQPIQATQVGDDGSDPPDEPPTWLDDGAGPPDEPPTWRDDAAGPPDEPPTHVDGDASQDEPPTHLDGADVAATGWTDPRRLPPTLAARFPDARPHRSGAQAFTFVATRNGEPVVVRVARAGVSLASDTDLTAITSPHLCRVLEMGTADGADYQVLEYVRGRTLAEHLTRNGRLRDPELRTFVTQMASALGHLEAAHIVHRDLKPANILVADADGPDRRFVVVDYGLTRQVEHTLIDAPPGNTPIYAEPLSFLGRMSRQCDWWSLGMITAELLLGRHPLADADPDTVGLAIVYRLFDLSAISDERWSLLVHGLLTENHELRWGGDEVSAWLAGDSPPVAAPLASFESAATAATALRAPVPPLRFAGTEFLHDPRRLADALGRNWDDAARMLGSPEPRNALARWCRQFEDADLLLAVADAGAGTRSLDQDLIRVIGALYRTARADRRGNGPCWYHGVQLRTHELHVLSQEGLLDVEALSSSDGTSASLAGHDALVRVLQLIEGDFAELAAAAGPGSPMELLHAQQRAGMDFVRAWTTGLAVPREPWEEALWAIRLLSCLTGPQQAVALREEASRAVRRRRDLRWLVGQRTSSSHHLVATIRARRAPRRRVRHWS